MKKHLRYYLNSFRFAFHGLSTLMLSERNMLIHILATLVVVGLGWWRGLSTVKWCLIVGVTVLVWVCEAFNTALERLCDLVHKDYHPLIRQAKDISAAAVLLAAIGAVIVGILVFFF